MSELFHQLESNNKDEVEAAKQKILEQFGMVKDSWLLNGLYDYYLSTNSANTIEILISIKEPHHFYLFDRLSESIGKSSKVDVKVQALTLLGHIVRNQPTWLYKLPEHNLLNVVLKLLKVDVEILPLISALLVLIVLIPMIPYSMGELLNDIFEIFSRLASWNCNPGKLGDDQVIHMQVALYALFLRLYGMFPCNFLAYLRTQYKDKNRPVFIHTIKPMLETVKINPSLVTNSKDSETTSERWKKTAVHDVIVECERYSLDVSDTFCAHDSCQLASGFRSRSGTSNSALEPSYFQSLKTLAASMSGNERNEYFTPSMVFNPQTPPIGGLQISTYIPQPEFTHDENIVPQAGSSPPEAAIEATPDSTPMLREEIQYTPTKAQRKPLVPPSPNQPQSPIRKEKSPFHFPLESKSSVTTGLKEEDLILGPLEISPEGKLKTLSSSSPLEIKTDNFKKSPVSSFELEELISDKKKLDQPPFKQSDSVLHESEDSTSENMDDDRSSPCSVGGLHMPNAKTIKNFAKRVQRLRHHSHCNTETERLEALGDNSPERGESTKVRRANSCPEMKKSPVSSIKDNVSSQTVDETDEETNVDRAESVMSNGVDEHRVITAETQTDNFWPMPYEHLFLGIFPTLGTDVKSSPGPSATGSQEKYTQPSIYELLDRYIETAAGENDKDNVKNLKNQLKLIHQHLLFERHRREIHAFKNRRFLADAKSTLVLEEHNSALRDQVQLQQTDIDNLRKQLENIQRSNELESKRLNNMLSTLEDKCKILEHQNKSLTEVEKDMKKELDSTKIKLMSATVGKQKAESALLSADIEVEFAKEQALAGRKDRAELEFVNKQLFMIGELQLKYKERLDDFLLQKRADREMELIKDSYCLDMKMMQNSLREKSLKVDACIQKISELEQLVRQNDETISSHKRTVSNNNEENEEKIKALESKYQTQLIINRTLEEKIFELRRQLELSMGKPILSPDTSSCQEVQVSSDKISAAVAVSSQRSSPLSVSLASSDGSMAITQPDMKNVQTHNNDGSPSEIKSDVTKDSENRPSTSRSD